MSATKIIKEGYKTSIGVVGLLLTISGTLISVPEFALTQKFFYLAGAILLTTSSLLAKHRFFILQQSVVLVGTMVAFVPVCQAIKAGVLIVLSIAAMIYFAVTGEFKERVTILGCLGLVFLALGYAVSHPIIYLLGGTFLTIYSFIVYKRGVTIGLLFGVLNFIFMITATIGVYNYYLK